MTEPKLIRNWKELSEIPNESETHILDVNIRCGNGHLTLKGKIQYDPEIDWSKQIKTISHYLSTHTFYGSKHEFSTKLLQACGFNVVLANWDKGE